MLGLMYVLALPWLADSSYSGRSVLVLTSLVWSLLHWVWIQLMLAMIQLKLVLSGWGGRKALSKVILILLLSSALRASFCALRPFSLLVA